MVKLEMNITKANWRSMHEARVDLIMAAHFNLFDEWFSMPVDPNPEAPRYTIAMMDQLEDVLAGLAGDYAAIARNPVELRRILDTPGTSDDYRVAVVHCIEGGHALGGDLSVLAELARRGVAYITISHFFNKGVGSTPNAIPFFPDCGSPWPKRGLSGFGREMVEEMEEQRIIIDGVHLSAASLAELLKITSFPIIASHASARSLGDHAYSFHDEHIVELIRRDGIMGVILSPHMLSNYGDDHSAYTVGSLHDVVRTVRHVVKISGTHKNVGIGSDFGGYISGPREMFDLGQIELLRRLLYEEFGCHDMVEDIMAGNVIRFLMTRWRNVGASS